MKGNEKNDPAPHKRIEKCESALMKFRFENRNVIFRLAIYFVIFVAVLPYKSSAYQIYTIQDTGKSIKLFQFLEKMSILRNKVLQLEQTIKNSQRTKTVNDSNSNFEAPPEKGQFKINEKDEANKIKAQYHFFVYPYFIYEFKNLTIKEMTELLREQQRQNLTVVGEDINSTQLNKSTEGADQDRTNQNSLIVSQLFLFRKIQVCSNKQNERLLNLLPNNIVVLADSDHERVNVFPATDNSLIFESILQDPQKSVVSVSVQLLEININNWIFFHIKDNFNYDKLFIQYKIFQDQLDISQKLNSKIQWDFSFNGSSIRFAKLNKSYAYKYSTQKPERTSQQQARRKGSITNKFEDFTFFLNKSSEMKVDNEPKARINQAETSLQFIESSLNVDPSNRRDRYKVKFCDQDYSFSIEDNNSYKKSYKVSLIGSSKKSDFFILLPKQLRGKQKMIRVMKANLKSMFIADAFYLPICQNSHEYSFFQKFIRNQYQDIIIYFEQQCKSQIAKDNNSQIVLGRLKARQLNYPERSQNILEIEDKQKMREYKIMVNYSEYSDVEIHIEKLSSYHFAICRKTNNKIICQLLNSFLFKIHSLEISLLDDESSRSKKISEILKWKVKFNILDLFQIQLYLINSTYQDLLLNRTIQIDKILQSLRTFEALSNSSEVLTSDFVLTQQKTQNSSISLFPEQQLIQFNFLKQNQTNFELSLIQNSVYLPVGSYDEKSMYIGKIWARKLQKKLKILHSSIWKQTVDQQLNNCEIVNQYGKISGIRFKGTNQNEDNNWKVCRLFIETTYENLVIEPDYDSLNGSRNISNPYKIYQCSIKTTETQTRCIYSEWEGKDFHALHQHVMTIFFFIRQGAPYNLKVMDLNLAQMDEIAQSFLIMFICILAMTCLLTFLIVCRPLCVLACTYMGWINSQNQAMVVFRYPLNCIQLVLKIKKLSKQKIIREYKYKKYSSSKVDISLSEQEMEDDCVFCLQQKMKGQPMIEIYCKHTYHKECFSDWVRQERNLLCPMCKRKLSMEGLNEYNQSEKDLKDNKKSEIQLEQVQ